MPGPQKGTTSTVTTPWWQPYVGGSAAWSVTPDLLGEYLKLRQQVQQMEQALQLMSTPEQAYNMSLAVGVPVSGQADIERATMLYDLDQAKARLAEMERLHPDLALQVAVNPQTYRNLQQRAAEQYIATGDEAAFKKSLADLAKYNVQPTAPPPAPRQQGGTAGTSTTGDIGAALSNPFGIPDELWRTLSPERRSAVPEYWLKSEFGLPTDEEMALNQLALEQQRQAWQWAQEDRQRTLEDASRQRTLDAYNMLTGLDSERQSWARAQQAARFQGWQETYPYAVPAERGYRPGFEPGGPVESFYKTAGLTYQPELYATRPGFHAPPQLGAMPVSPERQGWLDAILADAVSKF